MRSLLMVFYSVLTGCSTGMISKIINDPNQKKPTGSRVYITVKDPKDGSIDTSSILSRIIFFEAKKWLERRHFTVVDIMRKADSNIIIIPVSKSTTVYVPPYSYSVPTYGGSSGTTTTITNAYGNTIGTMQTQSSNPYAPTGYQTVSRGGYNKNVTTNYLYIALWSMQHGRPPLMVSSGKVILDEDSNEMMDDPYVMATAIETALIDTILGNYYYSKDETPINTEKDPGCWVRTGISFDHKAKIDTGSVVSKVLKGGPAHKAGVQSGDILQSIGDFTFPNNAAITWDENKTYDLKVLRNSVSMSLKIHPKILCIDDYDE